jgi:hypothetical protein
MLRPSTSITEWHGEALVCAKMNVSLSSSVSLPKVPLLVIGASAFKNVVSSVGDTAEESETDSSATARTSIVT